MEGLKREVDKLKKMLEEAGREGVKVRNGLSVALERAEEEARRSREEADRREKTVQLALENSVDSFRTLEVGSVPEWA